MRQWYRRVGWLLCGLFALGLLVGCRHKHEKVKMHEEQREGEVHEEQPGEMVPD